MAESSPSDKYGALKRLHEAIRRLAPQFKTQFAPQAWDDIPSAEKDCVAAALEEVFPSAEGSMDDYARCLLARVPAYLKALMTAAKTLDHRGTQATLDEIERYLKDTASLPSHVERSEIEDALWRLHSYESNRDDGGKHYSEADIVRMVQSVRCANSATGDRDVVRLLREAFEARELECRWYEEAEAALRRAEKQRSHEHRPPDGRIREPRRCAQSDRYAGDPSHHHQG